MGIELKNRIDVELSRVVYRYKVPPVYETSSRETDAFIYYVRGGHRFDFGERKLSAKEGDFVYIPMGAAYSNSLIIEDTEYYQIDFLMRNNGRLSTLFDEMQVISVPKSDGYLPLMKEVYDLYSVPDSSNNIACIGVICKMINMIKKAKIDSALKVSGVDKVYKSISYLIEHYDENITVEELADLSFTSVSSIEKIFRRCFGVSPVTYRNILRINHSKLLLMSGFSVSAAAVKVGFQDYYYFCKTFKKHTGISPGEFAKNNSRI